MASEVMLNSINIFLILKLDSPALGRTLYKNNYNCLFKPNSYFKIGFASVIFIYSL